VCYRAWLSYLLL